APDAVGVGHHAQVDPAPAAGAGLDLQTGVGGLELIDQVVDGPRLGVCGGPAGGPGSGFDQGPVVVPLDVVDLVLAHQGADPVPEVGVGLRDGQVQHLLVAVAHRQALAGGENPVRVGPGQVGVLVDHLWFEPEPELHAPLAHRGHQRAQAVGPHALIHVPVAQTGSVVPAVADPAI